MYLHNIYCARIWNMCACMYMRVHWSIMVYRKNVGEQRMYWNRNTYMHIFSSKKQHILLNTHMKNVLLVNKYNNILVYSWFDATPPTKEIPRLLHLVRNGRRRRRFRPRVYWSIHRGDRFKLYMYKYPSWYTFMYFTLAISQSTTHHVK